MDGQVGVKETGRGGGGGGPNNGLHREGSGRWD